jgi:hypothetical protein
LVFVSVFASACGDCSGSREAERASTTPPGSASAKTSSPPPVLAPKATPVPAVANAEGPIGCEAIPVGLVGELLGYPQLRLTNERIDELPAKATLCEYKAEADQKFASIRIERGYEPDRFEASKQAFPNATDIAGYGERAFMSSLPMMGPNTPYGIHSIAVIKGRTHMTISAPVPPEKVQLLARALLENL